MCICNDAEKSKQKQCVSMVAKASFWRIAIYSWLACLAAKQADLILDMLQQYSVCRKI